MKQEWWKKVVVYQIYPKNFQDTDGDGVGDIPGIISRLDYLQWLGVDVLWISPVYCSPMTDNGYDISGYHHIDSALGANEDMDRLVEEAGRRSMKILVDLMVNHTSNGHPWFRAAIADMDSKYASYYVLKNGKEGCPSDNPRPYFGGSAWERAGDTDRYYSHAFGKKQSDLNWDNPKLRGEIYQMTNYWLDKDVCGFRVDAIGNIRKNLVLSRYPAGGPDGLCYVETWIQNQPGIEDFPTEMKERTSKLHNSMAVAEVGVPEERLGEFVGKDGLFSMVFDLSYTDIDVSGSAEWFVPTGWTVKDIRDNLFHSQTATQAIGWGAIYLENHDQPCSINKYIPEADINRYSKTVLGTLFMILRGVPFTYQRQEIEMTNIHMDTLDGCDDLATHDQYRRAMEAGMGEKAAWEAIYRRGRDSSRTPMQWEDDSQADFSAAKQTWLKINSNYKEINVEKERADEKSVLHYYWKLIGLRKREEYRDVIIFETFESHDTDVEQVIAYGRIRDERRLLVLNNFGKQEREVWLPEGIGKTVLCSYDGRQDLVDGVYRLRPYESVVLS